MVIMNDLRPPISSNFLVTTLPVMVRFAVVALCGNANVCLFVAAFRDKDGYYWITGRTDDLLNVSGHLLSTAEVESALLNDKRVSEVAAVSMPHSVKGQCICVYAVTKNGYNYDGEMERDLRNLSTPP